MAIPFYNQVDQDIYTGGEHYIPQQNYRLNYTPSTTLASTVGNTGGVTNTEAAYPYIWPPRGGGGGGGGGGDPFGPNAITKDFDVRSWERISDPVHDFHEGDYGWVDKNITGYQTPSGWKTKDDKNIFHAGWGKDDLNRNPGDIEETEMDFSKFPSITGLITTKLRNWKKNRELKKQEKIAAADGTTTTATTTNQTYDPNVHGPTDYGKGSDGQQSYDSGQGFGINATTGGPVSNKTGRGRQDWAQGGRIGYRNGEFVEDINVEGPGFDENVMMASDDNNTRILENLFEKYLDLGFSPEDAEIKAMEEFELMSQGAEPAEGLASLV